ncbi:leiomodin-2a [Aplochiton taeniatus]
MGTFGYRKELGKYEELNEEELLATLSSEELQELERELADIDPDDNIPIGLRQKDQTAKTPTGTFSREALLKYWEEETRKLLEDNTAESSPGQQDCTEEAQGDKSEEACLRQRDCDAVGIVNPEEKHVGLRRRRGSIVEDKDGSAKDDKEDDDQKEKEDECKKEPSPKSGRLVENVTKGVSKRPGTKSPQNGFGVEKAEQILKASSDRPCGNPIVIDEALKQVLRNDPALFEVNLNNIEDISQESLLRFAEALRSNTHVHIFSLANTRADDRVAFAISKMLRENHSITNLNIESNFVSGQGILALLAALQHNGTLVELRFQNQRHICGGKVEMEMVGLLKDNASLLKLGYQFDLPGPRITATCILTRNQDRQRQRRLQQKERQHLETANLKTPTAQVSSFTKQSASAQKSTQTIKPPHHGVSPPAPPLLSGKNKPTNKMADAVKAHEGGSLPKGLQGQKKPKAKRGKHGANEKDSADIPKELKNHLRPSVRKKRDDPSLPPAPQRSSRDDLMKAIRGSSINSLKSVNPAQCPS